MRLAASLSDEFPLAYGRYQARRTVQFFLLVAQLRPCRNFLASIREQNSLYWHRRNLRQHPPDRVSRASPMYGG